MLNFKSFVAEAWAKPKKFPKIEEVIEKLNSESPKVTPCVGKFWKEYEGRLIQDIDAYHTALYSIYHLCYLNKQLPQKFSSGFGMPEGHRGYGFIGRQGRYHAHLTKKVKVTLCWYYSDDKSEIIFDLVPHSRYNEYIESDHSHQKMSKTKFRMV